MVGSPPSLKEQLVGFCKASRVLSKAELAQCETLAGATQARLQQRADALVAASQGLPVLLSYQADASLVLTAAQISSAP